MLFPKDNDARIGELQIIPFFSTPRELDGRVTEKSIYILRRKTGLQNDQQEGQG